MTDYDVVYERFLRKIADADLYELDPNDLSEELLGLLQSALGRMSLQHVKIAHDLSRRNDDTEAFLDNLDETEQELISYYMAIEWYQPKINSLEHTLLFIGSKDERWTPQKEHMNMLMAKHESLKNEARKLYRDYHTLANSYLEED